MFCEVQRSCRYRPEGIFSILFGPLGPFDFPGKLSKIIRAGDLFAPSKISRGDRVLVRKLLYPDVHVQPRQETEIILHRQANFTPGGQASNNLLDFALFGHPGKRRKRRPQTP